jgi:hypothetical protein
LFILDPKILSEQCLYSTNSRGYLALERQKKYRQRSLTGICILLGEMLAISHKICSIAQSINLKPSGTCISTNKFISALLSKFNDKIESNSSIFFFAAEREGSAYFDFSRSSLGFLANDTLVQ